MNARTNDPREVQVHDGEEEEREGLHGGAAAAGPSSCSTLSDVDIDPHTPGLGHVAASSIDKCCELCSSPAWWTKGCRFYTLSKGQCWFRAY